jgi:hypothetical protein
MSNARLLSSEILEFLWRTTFKPASGLQAEAKIRRRGLNSWAGETGQKWQLGA